MAKGDLLVQITDMAGAAIPTRLEVELTPVSGPNGAGGSLVAARLEMNGDTDLTVTAIPCLGGPGTQYQVRVLAENFRTYSFFQRIRENQVNPATDDVELWVKADKVRSIRSPGFGDLRPEARRILERANMVTARPEDRDLAGLSGAMLYHRMGPLRQACFLNLIHKSGHASAAMALGFIRSLVTVRQDRFFAMVDPAMLNLVEHERFQSAESTLHDPLPGFTLDNTPSIKSRDAHANLQITFMRDTVTGEFAADIDIDESTGIRHGFEVIRNAVLNRRTNPYLIREFLLASETGKLDPGYRFAF